MGLQALGLLVALMPTRQVRDLEGDWNAWAAEWMDAWDSMVHSNAWDGLWITFMSRLAKHDTAGVTENTKHPAFLSCLQF